VTLHVVDTDTGEVVDRLLSRAERVLWRACRLRSRPTEGHVYFVLAPEARAVKIGASRQPLDRLDQLRTANPELLHLVGLLPDAGFQLEAEIHQRFSDARRHGEWFDLTSPVVALIDRASW